MNGRSVSCLDLIERRFGSLTSGVDPLTLDGGLLGCGLPERQISLDELRIMLLKRQTSWVTKDTVWQELVRRAHAQPEPWVTISAGMMLPGLKSVGGKLGSRYPGDRNDLDSEILEGFLQALDLAEPCARKIHSQLYWAAFRRGHEACNRENRILRGRVSMVETCCASVVPTPGHPDIVLAEAMLDGVVTPCQADLISSIHLDRDRRCDTALKLGLSRHQVGSELASAKRRITAYLGAA